MPAAKRTVMVRRAMATVAVVAAFQLSTKREGAGISCGRVMAVAKKEGASAAPAPRFDVERNGMSAGISSRHQTVRTKATVTVTAAAAATALKQRQQQHKRPQQRQLRQQRM